MIREWMFSGVWVPKRSKARGRDGEKEHALNPQKDERQPWTEFHQTSPVMLMKALGGGRRTFPSHETFKNQNGQGRIPSQDFLTPSINVLCQRTGVTLHRQVTSSLLHLCSLWRPLFNKHILTQAIFKSSILLVLFRICIWH